MKYRLPALALTIGIAVSLFSSCKTSSTSPAVNVDTTGFDARGSDYFPVSATDIVSAHFRGAESRFDLNGSLIELDSIDQDRTAFVMGSAQLLGLPGFSIGAYNDRGNTTNSGRPSAYVALANGNVYGSDKDASTKALALPNALSLGFSWNPDPNGDPRYKASLAHYLTSFTNHNGNTYQSVIQVEGTYTDSTYSLQGSSAHINVVNVGATFYFAKGIGPVEINLHQYDLHGYTVDAGGIHEYERDIMNGAISRNR
ncbi:MAG: hypothetical protein Q8922_03165 [Bacteroidota bacterium]|nr:hypothetical protein [Bacteroidota bacterium]MDP4232966.1 hypothetical protein [Bacteroidota bacterium]MDP4242010.1 hypothetical protein [Bacteroidota bacterium]MDP4286913.1 hypothetical protein [Bacteroidota bacterium]